MRDLSRLLRPRSIALFGGFWAENVVTQLQRAGFPGAIWPVHPKRESLLGLPCFRDVAALPAAPDAAFIGVNRAQSVEIVRDLAAMGAGGAIAFASGFREAEAGDAAGAGLQDALVAAAGEMPLLGPNCYGLLNYLDNVALWPDQHGGGPVPRGVALVLQSSNIAINLTMQRRGLPLAYVMTAGNQAQTGFADLARAALADPRVTALGLHIEGFGDIRALEAMAAAARAAGKPVVALKTGRSSRARAATLSHTASLSGEAAAGSALLARLGITEVASPGAFLETLHLQHEGGPLAGNAVVSVSCSGGEAGLMADLTEASELDLRPFGPAAAGDLAEQLGPFVAIANPFDYHTFIWNDLARMTACFTAVLRDGFDLAVFLLDLPREDRCNRATYECALAAIIAARGATGARVAVLSTLQENLGEFAADRFAAAGIAVLHGLGDGIAAIDAAIRAGRLAARPAAAPALLTPPPSGPAWLLTEAEAKAALAGFGLSVPRGVTAASPAALAEGAAGLRFPVALKALGIAHKSEAGAVVLDLDTARDLQAAAEAMAAAPGGFLAEEMTRDSLAELILGVTRDATGLMTLTIGAGGVLTELLQDSATLVLPTSAEEIRAALEGLRIAPLLRGYRGKPAADLEAIVAAALALGRYAAATPGLVELDVNPLMAGAKGAVAVDALIRLNEEGHAP
ncbi:MAG: acetate--CoA ligase family protein [Rhodobacteraceae bacterium]|nr:acetate--CoA ligase family protein [Paracoccaceae bacterium]